MWDNYAKRVIKSIWVDLIEHYLSNGIILIIMVISVTVLIHIITWKLTVWLYICVKKLTMLEN